MKLNIHLISHPLIQNLSSITKNKLLPPNITNQALKHLGLFIMYETFRKWIKIYKLTIKQIQSKKEVVIIDPKESYTIVFNDLYYLSMFQEIQLLLPKINLRFIESNQISIANNSQSLFQNITLSTKIIIVNYKIDVYYIQHLIDYMINIKNIHINRIYLICIICCTDQLIQLSKQYNNLTIYTTQIIKT